MTELYPNISEEFRKVAETAWNVALAQKTPNDAANFLNNVTNYYGNLNEEEAEFLQFYFNTRMEMMKE